jgi:tRNA(Leu) C34 or U34 (ribose-2'-O)-methylase TrmL
MGERGFSCVGLFRPKTPANVGSVIRACFNFGSAALFIQGNRYHGAPTDTMKGTRHMPLVQVDDLHEIVPFNCVPVAVDLIPGATDIREYQHPERALYIFGPEDGTLGSRVTDWCRDVVFVPTRGCMNLACTVHTILFDRAMKRGEWPEGERRG